MERFILLSVLAIFLCTSATGQWYYKKYDVSSLNELTKSQLEESLKHLQSIQHGLLITMP
jgi:hypothetical protein